MAGVEISLKKKLALASILAMEANSLKIGGRIVARDLKNRA